MRVQIREVITNKVVADVPIRMGGLNYIPSEAEYTEEAWRCAVDDGLVHPDRRADYTFSMHHD